MKDEIFTLEDIYVPVKRRKTLDPEKVKALSEDILKEGMRVPIQVRHDGKRFILVEGLHRLEACRLLGETTIVGIRVQAKQR